MCFCFSFSRGSVFHPHFFLFLCGFQSGKKPSLLLFFQLHPSEVQLSFIPNSWCSWQTSNSSSLTQKKKKKQLKTGQLFEENWNINMLQNWKLSSYCAFYKMCCGCNFTRKWGNLFFWPFTGLVRVGMFSLVFRVIAQQLWFTFTAKITETLHRETILFLLSLGSS